MRIGAHAPERTFNAKTGLPVRYEVSDDAGRTWVVKRCLDNCTVEIVISPPSSGLDDFICSKESVCRAVRSHWAKTYDPARTRHSKEREESSGVLGRTFGKYLRGEGPGFDPCNVRAECPPRERAEAFAQARKFLCRFGLHEWLRDGDRLLHFVDRHSEERYWLVEVHTCLWCRRVRILDRTWEAK